MVGSIDPRCETIRGTHWPDKGRWRVWNSRRGNHLGQRSYRRINRPDIWMQAIRSDLKNSCGTGAVHIWVPVSDISVMMWVGGKPLGPWRMTP